METHARYVEKSVIIHRDESGFGFRVGGENPVYVDYVHENGAAWKAGVKQQDRIIKVNGTLVRSYDHQRVVHMIQNCTPFVNLTLHSPEPIIADTFNVPTANNASQRGEIITNNSISSSPSNNNQINSAIKVHLIHQRLQTNNLNWLLDIGDDLFQDYQQININNVIQSSHQSTGVSKLIEGGTTNTISPNQASFTGVVRPKIRQSKNQTNTRDNPYYYYKTGTDRSSDVNHSTSANNSPSSQDPGTSKSGSVSIVRSRSSGKMSTRSSSGKYKSRKLRSRLVSDFRSLTIANMQTTPSSLSSSPSSSDLSDCDDPDSNQPELSINPSSASMIGVNSLNASCNLNQSGSTQTLLSHGGAPQNPKLTTRRLEIIRELIDTEKTHTERLKHLNDLIYKPLKAEGLVPIDQLKMIFSCHKTLFKIHRQIYKILLAAQQNMGDRYQEPLMGRALVEIFEGELGKRLEKAASSFCACQSINIELLNRITRKDTKAGEFLAQVANQQLLGRLGIKDLLASCFQRLTKYPLLLDNLLKATPAGSCGIHIKSLSDGSLALTQNSSINNNNNTNSINNDEQTNSTTFNLSDCFNDTEEQSNQAVTTATTTTTSTTNTTTDSVGSGEEDETSGSNNLHDSSSVSQSTIDDEYAYERLCISRALQKSRVILTHVDEAVKRAISHNRLRDIWKKTDKNQPLPDIDIDTQQILHEGPLTLRFSRRSFDVYVLLLTDYLVILTREGQDKYKLKYFSADGKIAKQFSPVFTIDEHLATRDTATDENGFYLLCKRKDDSRIYEFASQSPTERAKWKEKIHGAQQFHYAVVPDDDNTLTRYKELITLATSSHTPNNIEHSSSSSASNPNVIIQ